MRRRVAFDGRAKEKPPLGGGEIGARMRGAAIVPKKQVPLLPDMGVNEIRIFHVIEKDVEKLFALRVVHAVNTLGHQAVNINGFAPGLVIGAEDGMRAFSEGLGAAPVALLDRTIIVMMKGAFAFQLLTDGWIEGFISGIAAR
jgi:hypothetical protein